MKLRIFSDDAGKMNRSVQDLDGQGACGGLGNVKLSHRQMMGMGHGSCLSEALPFVIGPRCV